MDAMAMNRAELVDGNGSWGGVGWVGEGGEFNQQEIGYSWTGLAWD